MLLLRFLDRKRKQLVQFFVGAQSRCKLDTIGVQPFQHSGFGVVSIGPKNDDDIRPGATNAAHDALEHTEDLGAVGVLPARSTLVMYLSERPS